MELPVKNQSGEVVGQVTLNDQVFGLPMNHALVHQVIVAQQANRRVGTHDTKTRGEVSGGGRKPWPQKHTGRARHGSIREPQWRHGGVAFGPHPRDYHQRIPKRMRRLAIKLLLSDKVRSGHITLLDNLSVNGKTKEMVALLQALGISKKCLVVTDTADPKVAAATRNLPSVKSLPAHTLNALDLITYPHLLLTVPAVRRIEALWAQERPRRAAQVA
ncbi:MAG: 50S ribosomal protein L4 [Dehalococcoidia bacterium]|nr:50S ribosomal protein L4 [Dehalococcoidia bacterium]MDW8119310.1 50S ribosomal protein L4 [Chloroflexota bacterium]